MAQSCPHCKEVDPPCGFSPSLVGRQGQWCRACLRSATHFRAWQTGQVRLPFPVTYVGRCVGCGGRRVSGKPGKFCSRKCKSDARLAVSRAARAAEKAAAPSRACPHCGDVLQAERRTDAVYCSERCNQAAHNATRKASWKIGERQGRVSRAYIVERDGSRCHVCRKRCRPGEVHLDHLVPLAAGGTHEPANLAVACAKCNLSRGARGAAQLLLVG